MNLFSKYQGCRKCNFDNKHYLFLDGILNYQSSKQSNAMNYKIHQENLEMEYTKLLYDMALQKQLFEREDTAYQRTVDDMSKAGLNPLMMQETDDSGDIVPTQAPQNGFVHQANPMNLGLIETLNGVANLYGQGIERDGMRLQNKAQELDNQAQQIKNLIDMDKHGITMDKNGNMSMPSFEHKAQEHDTAEYDDKRSSADRNKRENTYQDTYGTHDNSPREELLLTAAENQLENNNPVAHINKGTLSTVGSIYNILKNPIAYGTALIGAKANQLFNSEERKLKKEKKKQKTYNKNKSRDWSNFGSANW